MVPLATAEKQSKLCILNGLVEHRGNPIWQPFLAKFSDLLLIGVTDR